jgi:malonyl-CoA O-methyltransferase
MTTQIPLPDKAAVRRSFGRAATTYHAAAVLQKEVCTRLLDRLELIRHTPERVLDLGCGTGFATAGLQSRYPRAELFSLDLAVEMTAQARQRDRAASSWMDRLRGRTAAHYCAGDAECLPLASNALDMVFSSLTLQWCRPDLVFPEVARCLKHGGLFMFATLGPDTLAELRQAFAIADGSHANAHVNVFVDMHELGDALGRSGFTDPVMDMEVITLTYPDVTGLARDLKAIGAHNVMPERPGGLVGKARWRAVHAAYERHRRDGVLPATYEIVYGHAWRLEKPARQSGDAQIMTFHDYRPRT